MTCLEHCFMPEAEGTWFGNGAVSGLAVNQT
jgi:hypothetical protein